MKMGGIPSVLFRTWLVECSKRMYQTGSSEVKIFDGALKALHRSRAAYQQYQPDPLVDEVAKRVVERVEDCTRTFKEALILGGSGFAMLKALSHSTAGVERIVMADTSDAMLRQYEREWKTFVERDSTLAARKIDVSFSLVDATSETEDINMNPKSFDLALSCLGLHWVNDVPGVMAQCRHALRPDGLFLGAMFGGETLQELRIACTLAHQEREGGVSPRTSPLAHVRDAGNLLTRAGLRIPSVDIDEITVNYKDPLDVVSHLRQMGESNAMLQRREFLSRDTALAAAAAYIGLFGNNNTTEKASIPATYQIIYLTGWSPAETQAIPAKRGSATISFQELSKAMEDIENSEPKTT